MTRAGVEALADQIAEHLNSIFEVVLRVRDDSTRALGAQRNPTTDDLGQISQGLISRLRRGHGLFRGIGAIMAPGQLSDAPMWIEWWQLEAEAVTRTQFSFDAESIDFYDYTRADWFLVPHREGARSVVGPYVDFGGVNDYILTMTTPILREGSFAGVAGADLRVDELERRLYHAARGLPTHLALVNDADRVVGSTAARLLPGSVLSTTRTEGRVAIPDWPLSLSLLGSA